MDATTPPPVQAPNAATKRGTRKVPLLHKTGLHMRPAGRIMETASRFKADVQLSWGDRTANAKSILEMLSLAVPPGVELTLEAHGSDADRALDAIESLIRDRINREEEV